MGLVSGFCVSMSCSYIALTTCNSTTACASTPLNATTKLHVVGNTRYTGTLTIAHVALKPASSEIQNHVSCDKRGLLNLGHMNVTRLRSCMILLEIACQKFES